MAGFPTDKGETVVYSGLVSLETGISKPVPSNCCLIVVSPMKIGSFSCLRFSRAEFVRLFTWRSLAESILECWLRRLCVAVSG